MVLFNARGKLKRYDSAVAILEEFFALRLEFYEKRKQYLLKNLAEMLSRCGELRCG